jgi:amino acid transporter
MNKQNEIIPKKVKLLKIIWHGLIAETTILFIIAFFVLKHENMVQSKSLNHIYILYVSYIFSIISVPLSFKINEMKKNKADEVFKKVEVYVLRTFIKFAVLEIAAIISLLAFWLNQIYEPLYMFGIVFITIVFSKPSEKEFFKNYFEDDTRNDENADEESN